MGDEWTASVQWYDTQTGMQLRKCGRKKGRKGGREGMKRISEVPLKPMGDEMFISRIQK